MNISSQTNLDSSVLSLTDVYKSFDGSPVLRGVNLTLKKGAVMGLLGENGAGKTTLLKIALGLLKADQGDATVFAEDAWHMSAHNKQRLGYVAQTVDCFHWMTAQELFAYTGAFYENWDANKAQKLADKLNLDTTQRIDKMSIGQRQQASIIQALGHSPELLVLDEPVASLDPGARRAFIKELIDINLDEQTSIIFSTHITSDIERAAADMAMLKSGKVVYQGAIDELKEQVVRLRLESESNLPDVSLDPYVLNHKFEGQFGRLTVKGFDVKSLDIWEKELKAKVTVESLSLEDIFLELNV
ncbi:MAG: ABC transporter ATP-binding protein [Paraglaciecola sp.]|uniref:ABC transporter ATP-binding protein n=1 Tax=Paraglaciecola sp. TaxID=1920173 RepID=UPI0032677B98